MMDQLFAKRLIEDDRNAILSFQPFGNQQVDIFAPDVSFLAQGTFIYLVEMLVSAVLGIIMYYGIVKGQKPRTPATLWGQLLGYGIVIPFALYFPFGFINFFDVRSRALRLSLSTLPMTMTFTASEAMYGFTNPKAASSLRDYLLYVALIFRPKYKIIEANKKKKKNVEEGTTSEKGECNTSGQLQYIKSTPRSIMRAMKLCTQFTVYLSVLCSLFSHCDYVPFETSRPPSEVWVSFEIGQLYNNFLQATMLSFCLGYGAALMSCIFQVVLGIQFDTDICKLPMFLSSSPSDFWGRRWNNLVHYSLKQGIYKPLRWNTGSQCLAGFVAFFVSGLSHEYVAYFMYAPNQPEAADDNSQIIFAQFVLGKMTLFFVWNGFVVVLEYVFGRHFSSKNNKMLRLLPWWIRNHLVVMMALPVGHLFTADWTDSGFYNHLEMSVFKLQVA